ncbi:TAXI family TRAP transporter solute-binding subunit [Psychromonas sp. KJ10-10]|uniref:TAXI family TRAP transporter solute-binding subunit n=1 Tax=Psychromonas sp. KJ10-10 TaxID=3391823 RepID=UPI0039B6CC9E
MIFKKLAITAMTGATLMASVAIAETKHVVIGTGGQTGVYYQVGGAICRLVNRNTADHDINCTHKTGGSVTNINGLRSGDVDMGVAQSDWQYHSYNGTAPDTFLMVLTKNCVQYFLFMQNLSLLLRVLILVLKPLKT